MWKACRIPVTSITLLGTGSLASELNAHILISSLQLLAHVKTQTLRNCDACNYLKICIKAESQHGHLDRTPFSSSFCMRQIKPTANQAPSWTHIHFILFFNIPSKMRWICLEVVSNLTSGPGPTSHSLSPGWANSECECGPMRHLASL